MASVNDYDVMRSGKAGIFKFPSDPFPSTKRGLCEKVTNEFWFPLMYYQSLRARVGFSAETPEQWAHRWKDKCRDVRDAADLVDDLSRCVVNTQKLQLSRKRVSDV